MVHSIFAGEKRPKKPSTVLRELLEGPEILFRPGVGIAIQAQIAEAVGFKAVGLSGANTAAHIFGLPDAGLMTLPEIVENVRRVVGAVTIPVIADCDTGFGNAINVRRTVNEIIKAGAAGLFIEDQVSPKRCGFVRGKEVIPIDEAVSKYRAAVDARDALDDDFVLIARTDARGVAGGSVEDVIRRGKAYRDAGMDMIYAEALQSPEEIRMVAKALGKPFTCTYGDFKPTPTMQELQEWGLSMTASGFFVVAGLTGMWDLAVRMKEEGLQAFHQFTEEMTPHPLGKFGLFDLTGFAEVQAWEQRYLDATHDRDYDRSIGEYDPRYGHPAFAEFRRKAAAAAAAEKKD